MTGQGTNVIPVKGVQMAPLPDMVKKPLQLDVTGRLVMPQVQAMPQPAQMPQSALPQGQGQPQMQGSIMPDANPRINEIRNILGTATPEDSRISEIQAIIGGQSVTPQVQEQNTGIGYKVGEFAKDVAKSVIRPFTTPFAGFASGIQGLRGQNTEIQLPGWLGDARGSGDLNTQAKIAGGASLEALSLLPAGKALTGLRQVGTTPLRQLALKEAGYGAKMGLAGAAGYELGQSEDPTLGSVATAGLIGAGLGAGLGALAPTAGRFIQKYITKGNKIFNKSEQQLAQKYDDVLGTLKNVTDIDDGLQQQATALGMKPMSTGEFLLREGLPIGSREVNGRLTFRTADAAEALGGTLKELATAKKELLKVKPDNIFDLNVIKNRVISNIDQNLLAVDETRLVKLISNVFDEEIAKRGNVVNGEILERIKRGLQSKGKYSQQVKELPVDAGTAKTHREAAKIVREELEKGYNDIAELRRLNYIESQYINAIDVLNYLNKRPIQGGALSKDLAGITGAIIGGSSKLPVVGPMIGKEFAETVRNRLIDPKRRTRRLVSKMAKKDSETYGQKALQEFKTKSEQYKQTQKIIEQMLKPKFQTPLLESAQMRAQNTLQQGGEIAVSPAGEARVVNAIDRGDMRSLEQGYRGKPAPLDESAYAREAEIMANREATELAFNNFLKQGEIKEIEQVYKQTLEEIRQNVDKRFLDAIKKHPYFIKEKTLLDSMGEASVMDNGQTLRLATDKMTRAKLVGMGYKQVNSVDSMATQAGFDDPIDFLESLLELDKKTQKLNSDLKLIKNGKRPTGEAMGAMAGIEPELDKDGNPTGKFKFNVAKAMLGFAGVSAAKKIAPKLAGKGDDLIQEAKKYKSAEEFVKAHGKPVFSGGSEITKAWSNEKMGGFGSIYRGRNELGGGIYITDSPEYAKTFGSQLTESLLKPNLKLLDIRETSKVIGSAELNKIKAGFKDYNNYLKNGGEELLPTDYPNEIVDKIQNVYGGNSTDILKKAGFDGIIADESRIGGQGGTVWNIFDANSLQTKSQLTDIWNQANKKTAQ